MSRLGLGKKKKKGGRRCFHVLGAPNASGILSILYFLLLINIMGTPGTCDSDNSQIKLMLSFIYRDVGLECHSVHL